ncbi:hypothetical protein TNCV_1132691 [Trichonephila clavipes]|nr:hypothetical protein TNCV_1132691 [Trichonephila clavipes]
MWGEERKTKWEDQVVKSASREGSELEQSRVTSCDERREKEWTMPRHKRGAELGAEERVYLRVYLEGEQSRRRDRE